MKAIVLQGEPGKACLATNRPYPSLRPGYILVDVKAVALNPTDWKHIDFANGKEGVLSGCDFAGVVAQTGQGYSKQWKKGDRVCGFAHGGNKLQPEDGAFAERIVAKADISIRIPDHMSFEDAATLGVGVYTCGQGIFQEMGLHWPKPTEATNEEPILIYGGSSATGVLGIQFARLAGYKPLTTCSPSNFELVRSLGAAPFNYHDPRCVDDIKTCTGNNLKYIWDTIATPDSAKLCAAVIASGGTYGAILKVDFPRDDVTKTWSLGYTAMGEPVEKPTVSLPAQPEHFAFMKGWVTEVERLLDGNQLRVHQTQVGHGLENLFDGLDLMRKGKISGRKLVYVV